MILQSVQWRAKVKKAAGSSFLDGGGRPFSRLQEVYEDDLKR